jgi:hypothetical protein
MQKRCVGYNLWQVILGIACQTCLWALADADCGPYPISIKIGNVTLSNQANARGLAVSVGSPQQDFAFLPQW